MGNVEMEPTKPESNGSAKKPELNGTAEKPESVANGKEVVSVSNGTKKDPENPMDFTLPVFQDSSSEDPSDSSLPTPPDGGWGWWVVFGSFMIHVIGEIFKIHLVEPFKIILSMIFR